MPNFRSVVHFLLIDFGGGSSSCCSSSCDRGKTKSTPSLTRLRLEFDNKKPYVDSRKECNEHKAKDEHIQQ